MCLRIKCILVVKILIYYSNAFKLFGVILKNYKEFSILNPKASKACPAIRRDYSCSTYFKVIYRTFHFRHESKCRYE